MRPIPICEHVKKNGRRCGSPALRGRHFCYIHQHWLDIHPRHFLAAPPGRRRRLSVPLDQLAQELALQWFRRVGQLKIRGDFLGAKN
jgi:hypothetical protein